jgi:hypothetical protein
MTATPLKLFGLPAPCELRWGFLGTRWVPDIVARTLTEAAWEALDSLAVALHRSFVGRLGIEAAVIERAGAAVNACGGWWPPSRSAPDGLKPRSSLEVPALWAVREVDQSLLIRQADHADYPGRDARSGALPLARRAAAELVEELQWQIGPPYAPRGRRRSRARPLAGVWRRFEVKLGACGPLFLLPVLELPAPVSSPPAAPFRPRVVRGLGRPVGTPGRGSAA